MTDDAAMSRVAAVSPWARAHVDELAALEEHAGLVLSGDSLQHGDLYPFNVLLTPKRVLVVDWPHAWVGPRHCDVVALLSSVSLSGIDPQPIAEGHPLTRSLDAPRCDVGTALGFLLRSATSAGRAPILPSSA